MFLLRNLRILTKPAQNHVPTLNYLYNKRSLRGTSRPIQATPTTAIKQTLDMPNITATESQAEQQSAATTNTDLSTTEDINNALNDLPEGERNFVPTFNFAAYVNKSPTLQQLLKLGVDLHSIERRKGLAQFVLKLDFEKDMQPHLLFLHDQGVPAEVYGKLITKNPLLFKESLDDLQVRVNYLEAKKFTAPQRARIFTLNPYWLMYSTQRIDRRLGYFQREFRLLGDDVRFLASKQPRLITYNMEHIQKSTFCIREEMGFDRDEMRCLLLKKPRLWMMTSDDVIERFAYAHNEMQLPHDMILNFPEVLTSREFRLQQRHEFLKLLGRAQYNPSQDLYVSPRDLVEGTNEEFVQNVAKSDMQTFELFLRTR